VIGTAVSTVFVMELVIVDIDLISELPPPPQEAGETLVRVVWLLVEI
jgi:hypothetical protein